MTNKAIRLYLKKHTAYLRIVSKLAYTNIVSYNRPSKISRQDQLVIMTTVAQQSRTFHQFSQLTDDMQILILSFVATAPYECPSASGAAAASSTATSTSRTELLVSDIAPSEPTLAGGGLPAVSRKFRDYCRNSSLLWETILERAVQTQSVWKIAVETVDPNWQRRLLPGGATHQESPPEPQQPDLDEEDEDEVVGTASTTTSRSDGNNCALLRFYKQVCSEQILFRGPVFFMGMQGAIPSRYDLFLFEPRYRLMMNTLLAQHPASARHGDPIEPPVYFLHAYAGLTTNNTSANNSNNGNTSPPALLVQVQACRMLPDGSCSVTLVIKWFTHLEHVWVLPNSGHLYYAAAIKVRPAVLED
jgi:hypothetical protein